MSDVQSLEDGLQILRNDRKNGARVLATNALRTLRAHLQRVDVPTESNADSYWRACRLAGYELTLARPSMASAITSAVTNALQAIRDDWQRTDRHDHNSLRSSALRVLDQQIQERDMSSKRLVNSFLEYIKAGTASKTKATRILTLSSSSSLTACLRAAASRFPEIDFEISVLESRPSFEGATFATDFVRDLASGGEKPRKNTTITVAPDSHVCAFARKADLLLLGADRISADGDVSNKMGSLAAALAIRAFSSGKVLVVAETDKIARPGSLEEHQEEDNDPEEIWSSWPGSASSVAKESDSLRVRNVYFEWILRQYVDGYITEQGAVDVEQIKRWSKEKGELEDELFDHEIKAQVSH